MEYESSALMLHFIAIAVLSCTADLITSLLHIVHVTSSSRRKPFNSPRLSYFVDATTPAILPGTYAFVFPLNSAWRLSAGGASNLSIMISTSWISSAAAKCASLSSLSSSSFVCTVYDFPFGVSVEPWKTERRDVHFQLEMSLYLRSQPCKCRSIV